jgi:pimeloyl-ACP methyl ester carboxylesterase
VFKKLVLTLLVVVLAAYLSFRTWPVLVLESLQHALFALQGFSERTVEVDHHHIHALVGGKGPDLVFLHGFGGKALETGPFLGRIATSHRVIAIDMLGFGQSDAPDVDYSIPTQRDAVTGALAALGVTNADFMGFSMGGWVSLAIAREHPDLVRRLVLVGSGGLRFPTDLDASVYVPRTVAGFDSITARSGGAPLPPFIARDLLRRLERRRWALERAATRLFSFQDALDGQLATVSAPALVVWGKDEHIIPVETGERLARELPHARFLVVDDCGHMLLWQRPGQALPAILAFLAGS